MCAFLCCSSARISLKHTLTLLTLVLNRLSLLKVYAILISLSQQPVYSCVQKTHTHSHSHSHTRTHTMTTVSSGASTPFSSPTGLSQLCLQLEQHPSSFLMYTVPCGHSLN